jgi:hypothetical protein
MNFREEAERLLWPTDFVGAAEAALRRAYRAGQEEMRERCAEYVSDMSARATLAEHAEELRRLALEE